MKSKYWILWSALPVVAVAIGLTLGRATAQTARTNREAEWASRLLSKQDSELDELVARLRSLGPSGEEGEKSELRNRITALTREQFLEHEATRERHIQAIEERVAKIKRTLELRTKNMESIIEARVNSLLGESSALDWNFEVTAVFPELRQGIETPGIETRASDGSGSLNRVGRRSGRAKLHSDEVAHEKQLGLLKLQQAIEADEEKRNAVRFELERARESMNSAVRKTQGRKGIDANLQSELAASRRNAERLSQMLLDMSSELQQKMTELHAYEQELLNQRSIENEEDERVELDGIEQVDEVEAMNDVEAVIDLESDDVESVDAESVDEVEVELSNERRVR